MSIDSLADAVWGEELPDDARRSIRTYVTRLRGVLGADSIVTTPEGYRLKTTPDNVDAIRFERLLDAATRSNDPKIERERLDEALALWRGIPFTGVNSASLERSESARLTERHLAALERHIDLDIAEGSPADLVPRLRELTAQHPLRERFWSQLMLVLYRAGLRADALATYRRMYQLLDAEIGVEPGRDARELHQRIVRGDPTLDREPPSGARPAGTPVPRQLPPGIGDFVGRSDGLKRLDALLPSEDAGAPTAVVISAIAGTAGIGKTALAIHWAHTAAAQFPDGQLYVNLRGFDPSGEAKCPDDAVRGFLDALGVPSPRIPADPHVRAGLYRSLLAGKRVLILLDNARDAEQVRPLLPGTPGCLVLVTSRHQLPGLVVAEGAHPLLLDVLTEDEARHLFARRLGAARITAEPEAVDQIIDSCARLPLALAIVAARAATNSGFSLSTLASELRGTLGRLDALASTDVATDLRAVFSWSYATLSSGAARLFRLLGLHPGPDISAAAATSLAGVPLQDLRPLLGRLCQANLIAEHRPQRYTCHDLLRAYATELAHTEESPTSQREARHRILDHYLRTAHAAALLLNRRRDPISLPHQAPGVSPEPLMDHREALAWLTAEHAVLLATVAHAGTHGFATHVWQLAWALSNYLDRQGHWHDWVHTQRQALDAALREGKHDDQAQIHRSLAGAYARLDRPHDAHLHLRQAHDLYQELGDSAGQARTLHNLAYVFERQGRFQDSLEHSRAALSLYRTLGNQAGQARALNLIGWYHAHLGDHGQALIHCEEALALHRALGDRHGQAEIWDSLGYAHHHLGRHDQAVACFQQSIDLDRELGDRYNEAHTLTRLGDTHDASGNAQAARAAWQHAFDIFVELDHPDIDGVLARLKAPLP